MIITSVALIGLIEAWLWPFFRIAGMLMVAPIIGTRSVPTRIRLGLAVSLTFIIVPIIPSPDFIEPLSLRGALIVIEQILIGIGMGLSIRLIFIVLEMAGQAIGQLMGLMLAAMIDPQNGNHIPIIGQFYLLFSTLLILSVDGHLLMIKSLAESFTLLPVASESISRDAIWLFVNWGKIMFEAAVLLALPAIISMLIVNIGFGVMTRAAPQMNIFAVGFPVMIVFGIIVVMFTLEKFAFQFIRIFEDAHMVMLQLLQTP